MSLTRRSRERANELLVALAADFGAFAVREERWERSVEAFDRLAERFESGANGGAGIWVRDGTEGVLLVRHEGEDGWSEPAGKREPGEAFPETAVREVAEETGIEAAIEAVHEVTLVTHDAPDRPPLVSPIVLFTGWAVDGTDPEAREGEIAEVAWWREPPASVLYDAVREYPFPDG